MSKKRIVILGGGFSGLYTALEFEKELARSRDLDVTLVNRENFFLFTPMLHEVAAGDLDLSAIVNPVRKLLRRVKFFNGDVQAIDAQNRRVIVSHGTEHHDHVLEFDHLVVGLGSITNFLNIPGLQERAHTMKSLGDAIHLRNRLIANLEEADFECCAPKRQPLLTVVVAGGGFAGVETIASINDFLHSAIRHYPNLTADQLRLVLVHSGQVILPELGEKLGLYAQERLSARGIELKLKTRVTGVTPHGISLSDGTMIPSETLIWTAGTTPNPILDSIPCSKEKGRIVVDAHLQVQGADGLWAAGDCASIPDVTTGKFCPPTAQHALREGKVLAQNILAAIRGGRMRAFKFSTIGQLAAIGHRTGVARIFGINFSGFAAWWLWRTIYLSKLPRFEKKLRVALDWTLDLFFSKDLVQFLTLRAPIVSHAEGEVHHASPADTEACPVNIGA